MTWDPTQNFQNAGLMVYGDDDNYIKTGMVWNGARNFELIKELDGGRRVPRRGTRRRHAGHVLPAAGLGATATRSSSEFSSDGETWTEIGTTDLTGIENPRIGVYATASTQAGAAEPTASFHSVTIEPDRAECPSECPTDEFDGTELDTGKWSFLHPSTETAPFVEAGNLVFTLSEFSFDADRPGPASILGQQMPQDDWDVVAKISAPGLNDGRHRPEPVHEGRPDRLAGEHDRSEQALHLLHAQPQRGRCGGDHVLRGRGSERPRGR